MWSGSLAGAIDLWAICFGETIGLDELGAWVNIQTVALAVERVNRLFALAGATTKRLARIEWPVIIKIL